MVTAFDRQSRLNIKTYDKVDFDTRCITIPLAREQRSIYTVTKLSATPLQYQNQYSNLSGKMTGAIKVQPKMP